MAINVLINGFGRIGRQLLRVIYDYNLLDKFNIVAINASGDIKSNSHLLKYDTVHHIFNAKVEHDDINIIINNKKIAFFSTKDPTQIPISSLNIDLILECSGNFKNKEKANIYIKCGAKKVLLSYPGDNDIDATIVFGVNDNIINNKMKIISNASCTTNCLAPLIKSINDKIKIIKGSMTTIHSYTNDQVLTDSRHEDLRRARSATQNIIPTKTGAAKAIELIIPELKNKVDGIAVRVPTINVSLVDFNFESETPTSIEEINSIVKNASQTYLKGILEYIDIPLVSSDFNNCCIPSIFDSNLTKVLDKNFIKVLSWYDNEWGFCCQMLNVACKMFDMQHIIYPRPNFL